ncbi:MAG TPA: hypothetical protein VMA37_09010 [Acetobacteraceae bacterium]|nr:hypothetical protein [Acetobacteraceae bacterium]
MIEKDWIILCGQLFAQSTAPDLGTTTDDATPLMLPSPSLPAGA